MSKRSSFHSYAVNGPKVVFLPLLALFFFAIPWHNCVKGVLFILISTLSRSQHKTVIISCTSERIKSDTVLVFCGWVWTRRNTAFSLAPRKYFCGPNHSHRPTIGRCLSSNIVTQFENRCYLPRISLLRWYGTPNTLFSKLSFSNQKNGLFQVRRVRIRHKMTMGSWNGYEWDAYSLRIHSCTLRTRLDHSFAAFVRWIVCDGVCESIYSECSSLVDRDYRDLSTWISNR